MSVNQNNISLPVKLLSVSAIVLVIDQITKYLTKHMMTLRESIPVIGDTLRLTYIENDGMAFGIAIGNKILFNLFSIIAAGAILLYMLRLRHSGLMPKVALAVIFGGASGNLVDRLLYGSVVDFLDMNIPNIPELNFFFFTTPPMNRWPIFNVADIAVSVGMILLIISIFAPESCDDAVESIPASAPAEDAPQG